MHLLCPINADTPLKEHVGTVLVSQYALYLNAFPPIVTELHYCSHSSTQMLRHTLSIKVCADNWPSPSNHKQTYNFTTESSQTSTQPIYISQQAKSQSKQQCLQLHISMFVCDYDPQKYIVT